jgi:3-deoxy-D-manno-octulosonic acid (KDO) 8-phosphate synthase
MERGLEICKKLKMNFNCPYLPMFTKHGNVTVADVVMFCKFLPFLSRQTDLLIAAAKTGKIVT